MRVLVISVHPDDETMGCGGTLLKHREAGDAVSWLILTHAHEPEWPAEVIREKAAEVTAVAQAYAFERVVKLGLPTARLDTLPQAELMRQIRGGIAETKPDCVYLVNRSDVHSDHRAAFEATTAVIKPFFREFGPRRLLCYESLSSTDAAPALAERAFVPTVFSDITAHLEQKIRILELYRTELQREPLPREASAVRALARVRGAAVGVRYAEAFMLLREVI